MYLSRCKFLLRKLLQFYRQGHVWDFFFAEPEGLGNAAPGGEPLTKKGREAMCSPAWLSCTS